MNNRQGLLIAVLLVTSCTATFAQTQSADPESNEVTAVRYLRNADVLRLVQQGEKSGDIIAKILTSHCNFDVFPPVLRDLKRRGVPDTVLLAMKMAPSGPPALRPSDTGIRSLTTSVKIPAGTAVEVEAAYPISSAKVQKGDLLTFKVTRPVFINGVLVIAREAVAKARVVSNKPAGRWGRAGVLAWAMEYVVAVDGTRLPLEVSGRVKGNNRSAVVAGGALATGALVFPYTSPVGLIWGLKKGDEAILRGSKPFAAVISTDQEVAGLPAAKNKLILHDMDTVKAAIAPPPDTPLVRLGIRH
jgi:hypothetical protein